MFLACLIDYLPELCPLTHTYTNEVFAWLQDARLPKYLCETEGMVEFGNVCLHQIRKNKGAVPQELLMVAACR